MRTDCSSTDPVGFTKKETIVITHTNRNQSEINICLCSLYFFQKPEPTGTERIINIVKTGVPAEKSQETKIETKVENETKEHEK